MFAGFSTVANAQDNSKANTKASSNDVGEIIVTARRVSENLQSVPVAVTALSAQTLSRMSIRNVRDLTSISPNLMIMPSNQDRQTALISLRGQIPSGVLLTTDGAVGTYIDGINSPRAVGVLSALLDVARVEVLRGPQGTLYGRNTTGGAISIITNEPLHKWEGSAKLQVGNYGLAEASAMLNTPITQNIAARFVAQRGVNNGYFRGLDGKKLSDRDDTYVRAKIRGEFGRVTVDLFADYSRNDSGGDAVVTTGLTQYTTPIGASAIREVAAEMGLPQTPDGWAAALQTFNSKYLFVPGRTSTAQIGSTDNYSRFSGYSAGIDVKAELSDKLTIRSLTGYRHYNRDNDEDLDGSPYEIIRTLYVVHDDFYSQEFQLLGNFGRINFVSGVYGSYEDGFDSNSTGTVAAINAAAGRPYYTTLGGFVKSTSLAAFAQVNWKVTDRLTLTGGGRYTKDIKEFTSILHNNPAFLREPLPAGTPGCLLPTVLVTTPGLCRAPLKKSFTSPSWLASADFKINHDLLIYAKVSHGYRAGGQNLRGTNIVGLQPFGPEEITEYEIGLKSEFFDRRVRANVALFHDDYSGVQRTIALIVDGISANRVSNAASAKIDGVEGEFTVLPVPELSLSANLGYNNARYVRFVDTVADRTHEAWPTPKFTYAFSARYTMPIDPGSLLFQVDYQGRSRQNLYPAVARQPGDVTQPAYGLLNARVSLTLDKAGMDIAVFARNLTDKFYFSGGLANEGLGLNNGILGEPRIWGAEITKRF
jgi:iron complex outermembrane receptor protein